MVNEPAREQEEQTRQPKPRWWRDNGLSLAFGFLLLVALAGQAFWGQLAYNEEAQAAGLQQIGLGDYITSSSFAVDVAENWQSEYLQFLLFILATIWLVQRGSSESKKIDEAGLQSDEDMLLGEHALVQSPRWAKAAGWRRRLYSHSLTLAMGTIFMLSWAAQAIAGRVAGNEQRMRDLLEPLSLGQYLASSDFWGRTLQNWQSEFLAVGSMAVFSIWLRERGSPESKPVGSPHDETTSDD